jgi:hypothetical protein
MVATVEEEGASVAPPAPPALRPADVCWADTAAADAAADAAAIPIM